MSIESVNYMKEKNSVIFVSYRTMASKYIFCIFYGLFRNTVKKERNTTASDLIDQICIFFPRHTIFEIVIKSALFPSEIYSQIFLYQVTSLFGFFSLYFFPITVGIQYDFILVAGIQHSG